MTTLWGREWSPTGAMDMGARSAPGMRQAAATEHRPDGQVPQHLEIAAQAGPSQELFLAALARLEQWLAREQIPYAVFGSVAACAWTDQGVSLDFNRTDARDPAERLPDIDVLVPRASIGAVRS